MSTDISTILSTYNEARDTLRKVTAEQLLPAFADALRKVPEVKCLTWTQYTPYFNDGEPCTFGVHVDVSESCRSVMPPPDALGGWEVVAGERPPAGPPDSEDEDEAYFCYEFKDSVFGWSAEGEDNKRAQERAHEVVRFVDSLPEEIMARVLGDGVRVFAWEGGILTTGYQHD